MRKALLHVKTITAWTLDTDVMHVIAPEIRAAVDEIDDVCEEALHDLELDDIVEEQASKSARHRAQDEPRGHLLLRASIAATPAASEGARRLGRGTTNATTRPCWTCCSTWHSDTLSRLPIYRDAWAVDEELPIASMMQRIGAVIVSVTRGREMPAPLAIRKCSRNSRPPPAAIPAPPPAVSRSASRGGRENWDDLCRFVTTRLRAMFFRSRHARL